MNRIHEANREFWNKERAKKTQQQSDEAGIWKRCLQDPNLAFDCEILDVIQESVDDLTGKDICLVGSGDNHAAFALAGLGAKVTSVDQSEKQLEVASRRATELGLSITFVQSDATGMGCLGSSAFDLVCSTNGFLGWISDLDSLFSEIQRILKNRGFYIFYDIHPFQRPWKGDTLEMEKPYFETGPFHESKDGPYFFHWTMGDLVNSLANVGFTLRRMRESPARDSSMWETGNPYLPGRQPNLLDWRVNPITGLPVWLIVAAQNTLT